ncbi:hypothetical protein G8X92_06915 [Staphylococcus aureus]|nr:hypothetical protein [Staphylococcus aureus]
MTDNARKEYLNQFFGSKRYLYQDNEKIFMEDDANE